MSSFRDADHIDFLILYTENTEILEILATVENNRSRRKNTENCARLTVNGYTKLSPRAAAVTFAKNVFGLSLLPWSTTTVPFLPRRDLKESTFPSLLKVIFTLLAEALSGFSRPAAASYASSSLLLS